MSQVLNPSVDVQDLNDYTEIDLDTAKSRVQKIFEAAESLDDIETIRDVQAILNMLDKVPVGALLPYVRLCQIKLNAIR